MAPPLDTYDLVSVLNVLLHIVDEVRFESARRNIASAVRPGGHLLMVEPIQTGRGYKHRYLDGSSSLARPATSYVTPLIEAGLVLSAIEPATVIGSDPYEASSQTAFAMWMSFWRLMKRPLHRFPASAEPIGRLIYSVDPILVRAGFGPSSKIALFRRPSLTDPVKSRLEAAARAVVTFDDPVLRTAFIARVSKAQGSAWP